MRLWSTSFSRTSATSAIAGSGARLSVGDEHFATNVIRGRLLGLARGWGRGLGPVALLACLPGEQHELGLLAFGLALRAHGWRVSYFGGDTPLEERRARDRGGTRI